MSILEPFSNKLKIGTLVKLRHLEFQSSQGAVLEPHVFYKQSNIQHPICSRGQNAKIKIKMPCVAFSCIFFFSRGTEGDEPDRYSTEGCVSQPRTRLWSIGPDLFEMENIKGR